MPVLRSRQPQRAKPDGEDHNVRDEFVWAQHKDHRSQNEREGTAREVKEELSLDITITDDLGSNEYIASHPEKGKVRKRVSYFLAEAKDRSKLKLIKEGGLDQAGWFTLEEVGELRMYDDIIPIITAGIKKIVST